MQKQITLSLTLLLALTGTFAQAQAWKSGLKAVRRSGTVNAYKATETARAITSRVQLQQSWLRKPVLHSLEPNIRRFIFTVAPRGAENGFKGSGFVFADKHNGQTVLWGASAAHTVRHMGKDVTVTFHLDGENISFPATVELTGRKFGLNAALIKLPEDVTKVALPIEFAESALAPKAPLFTYGFSAGNYKKTVRSVLLPGEDRLLADFPRMGVPKPGFCGSLVVNEYGQAVGIETGGYKVDEAPWGKHPGRLLSSTHTSRVSEIVPIRHLTTLLREFYTPNAGDRVILFSGMRVGMLGVDEYIERIHVLYKNGSFEMLERSPLWETRFLEQAVPNIDQALGVQILINKNRETEYLYRINLQTRTVTREEF